MPKYEMLILGKDFDDLPSGHKRAKEGDIAAVKPYPHNWGSAEIKMGLILIVSSVDNKATMEKLTNRQFATDVDNQVGFELGTPVAKRRYNIPLDKLKKGWITDLDLVKVADGNVSYQPFKTSAQLVQKFDGVGSNNLLTELDVDCESTVASKTTEFTLDMDEKVAISFDKFKGSFKYAKEKVA